MQRESANASFGINPTSRRSHVPSSVGEIGTTDLPHDNDSTVAVSSSKFARLAIAARGERNARERRKSRGRDGALLRYTRFIDRLDLLIAITDA